MIAALALVGIVAFPLLPVAPLPQVDFPTIQVTATLTGANPATMGATVATPLERQFGQIAGATQMSPVSSPGSTVITVQFDLNRNIDWRRRRHAVGLTAAGPYRRRLWAPLVHRPGEPPDSCCLKQHGDGGDDWQACSRSNGRNVWRGFAYMRPAERSVSGGTLAV